MEKHHPRCKWCKKQFPNKFELSQHESSCEWKEKVEAWQKRVAENQGEIFWYVSSSKSGPSDVKKCVLSDSYEMIRFFGDDGELKNWSQGFKENNLFENEIEAQDRFDNLKRLYLETFKFKPFLSEEVITSHLKELKFIESEITNKLTNFLNFLGIDFCDVSANGIQIRGHHKEVDGYTYGTQPTIKYDFSNYRDCVDEFVHMWIQQDTPERVRSELRFIADGKKYGWN